MSSVRSHEPFGSHFYASLFLDGAKEGALQFIDVDHSLSKDEAKSLSIADEWNWKEGAMTARYLTESRARAAVDHALDIVESQGSLNAVREHYDRLFFEGEICGQCMAN